MVLPHANARIVTAATVHPAVLPDSQAVHSKLRVEGVELLACLDIPHSNSLVK